MTSVARVLGPDLAEVLRSSPAPQRPRKRARFSSPDRNGPVATAEGAEVRPASSTSPGSVSPRPQPTPVVTQNFINGQFCMSKSRTWCTVLDPVTHRVLTRVPESTSLEIDTVIAAARSAQPAWAALSTSQRRIPLLKWLETLREHSAEIVQALQLELGKTLQDAASEVDRGLDSLEAICSSPMATDKHWSTQTMNTHTMHQPLGVCLSVTPFNFPFMIALWSIPIALQTGNAVLLKPSEKAPSVTDIMARCANEAGLLAGIFNIIHGGSGVVDKLLANASVKAVSFVGSEAAGDKVYLHAQATKKRVQVETSGKNHGVALEDANKKSTIYAIAGSAFGYAGQRCMAMSVIVCVGSTKHWIKDLVTVARSLSVGCGFDKSTAVGPLITNAAKERVVAMIDFAEAEGAEILLDGRHCNVPAYPEGNFVGPTIITKVKTYMQCYQEEIFGPVLVCLEADTLQEAIEIVNENRYGNGCTLFTTDPVKAQTFSRDVNIGQIGINVPILAASGAVPRTPNKDSFVGDSLANRNQWEFFTHTKTVSSIWR